MYDLNKKWFLILQLCYKLQKILQFVCFYYKIKTWKREKKDVRIDSIKLEKEDNNLFLRIVIDSDEIIDVDKCVEVTNIINPLLDEKDLIKESYILDVSTKEKGR